MSTARILTLLFVFLGSLGAQDGAPTPASADPPPLSSLDRKREALSRILLRQEAIANEIIEIRKELATGTLPKTDFDQTEASKKIAALQIESDELGSEFSKISSGLNVDELPEAGSASIMIEEEIREIFKPIIQEFREITAAPRKAEELRTDINELERKLQILDEATTSLRKTITASNPQPLKDALELEAQKIKDTRLEIETELGIAQSKLEDLQRDSPTFLESLSMFVQDFFRSRGTHLLIAIGVTLITLLVIRIIYRFMMKVGPRNHTRGETFTGRLIHLCFMLASFVGGVIAFLFTLYLANDWLLLAFALLFLFGLAWTGKNTIPQFFEQGKMILNLGTVRQNERIIYEGIPWEVQKVNLYTSLLNPALEGGKIRLPIRDLMDLHSRPNGEAELWTYVSLRAPQLVQGPSTNSGLRPHRKARRNPQGHSHRRIPQPPPGKLLEKLPPGNPFWHRLQPSGNRDLQSAPNLRGECSTRPDRKGRQRATPQRESFFHLGGRLLARLPYCR